LDNPLDRRSNFATYTGNVFTGTDGLGNDTGLNCFGWTQTTGNARLGTASSTILFWTNSFDGSCSVARPIYCFQTN
jgi:hypothetical protein